MKQKIIITGVIIVVALSIIGMIYLGITNTNKENELDKHLVELTYSELMEKIDNKESFILIFTQTDCSHCHEYKPVLKKILAENDIIGYELNLKTLSDEEKAKVKADVANVEGTPTTVFIENGQEKSTMNRINGNRSETDTINQLKKMGYIK